MTRVRDGLAWRWHLWRRCAFLVRTFRNGLALARAYRGKRPCGQAKLWDGTQFRHPPARTGLAETILEVWYDEVYTGAFYRPTPGDVIIDAGANIGLFAVWLARRHPDCRVLAVEPFGENFALLEANIASARVSNVSAHKAGLGGETGRGRMESVGARSLDHRMSAAPTGGVEGVPVYSFADALRLAGGRVALFKIDIEGSEHDLFARAAADDLAGVARYAIEY
ncbi:MAG: FkbM family methyltransferase, partial [Gemmataceae bacterium]|nr:FkbM family methyltransferase [Gemmataceae bacterium]